ncbi:MAG: hypothetical protein Q7W51_06290 [Coriobacteriia bacterium]|nr:hypothetical protein [Coriobacteriia bacterium]
MSEGPQDADSGRFAVLDVFGITLEVSNPRLAELLTMDASDALTSDVRDLASADRRAVSEALPDSIIAMPNPHSEAAERTRREFRTLADALAADIGFTVESDGTWCSPTGIDIVMRTVDRPLTPAAAAHYVSEVAAVTERLPETSTVLFVVADQQTADAFKVAIRQRKLHNLMRTIAIDSLESVREMHADGRLDHRHVLVLLAPIADIDVGEMIAVFRAGAPAPGGD